MKVDYVEYGNGGSLNWKFCLRSYAKLADKLKPLRYAVNFQNEACKE